MIIIRLAMYYPQIIPGISHNYPWIILRLSPHYLLISPGLCPDYTYINPRFSLDYPWNILELSPDYPGIIPRLSQDYPKISRRTNPGLSMNYPLIKAGESKILLFETFLLFFFPTGSVEELALLKISRFNWAKCHIKLNHAIYIKRFVSE